MTVWKFPITIHPGHVGTIALPEGASIVAVQLQGGEINAAPHLWALVDPVAAKVDRTFAVVGTGWNIDHVEGLDAAHVRVVHVGMWQSGPFVWHLLELVHVLDPVTR